MRPKQSYRIWFTQRNGSTLLCKGLEETKVAGKPGEFFNISQDTTLCEKYGVNSYEALRDKLWKEGCSENGVMGIKHSFFTSRSTRIYSEFADLKELSSIKEEDYEQLLSDLFPNCQHIFLTRRNKIRQVVSWWKAIKNNQWHLEKGEKVEENEAFFEANYDFDALNYLLKEAVMRECAIQAYFSRHQIQPLTLVYEDFIQDFTTTLKTILSYLNIDSSAVKFPEMYYQKTATDYSEIWVQRFRKELQADWKEQTW